MPEFAHEYESDHHPEAAQNAIRRLERLGLNETLAEAGPRRDYFSQLDDEGYQKLLGYVNSVTLGEPISYEYGNGRLHYIETPAPEDKDELMRATFETCRMILARDDLTAEDALDLAGLTLAGAINFIHPYDDGNGRTGRVAHYLVTYGCERGEALFEAELYGAIADLPAFDVDARPPIHDQPATDLMPTIEEYLWEQHGPDTSQPYDRRQFVSDRIQTYLKLMRGDLTLTLPADREVSYVDRNSNYSFYEAKAGMDLVDYYRYDYAMLSSVPNNAPDQFPANSTRVFGTPRESRGL